MQDIVIEGLTKGFGAVVALPPTTAKFPAGEVTCILGPSGCGKTTLLRLLMGLEAPSGGRFSGMPDRVSVVFQEDRLLPEFSSVGNIQAVVGKQVSEQATLEMLGALGLAGWERTSVQALSGGMRRRVAIARALLLPAEVILMDEPFKGLDEETKERVMTLVQERTQGKTLLLVTHDEREAHFFGENLLRMGK